jgi:hypothetical protein
VVSWIVPFASLVTAAIVPLAAGLYLLTTTAWTLAERTLLRRRFLTAPQGPAAPRGPAARHRRRSRHRPPLALCPGEPGSPARPEKPLGLGWGLAGTLKCMQVIMQRTDAAARAISSPVAAA